MLGHGAMIAYLFPQIEGALLPISQLVNVGLRVAYSADSVTYSDFKRNEVRTNADSGATGNYLTVADIGVL